MKKKITNPEVIVVKLQKMNVIATSGGDTPATPQFSAPALTDGGNGWYKSNGIHTKN